MRIRLLAAIALLAPLAGCVAVVGNRGEGTNFGGSDAALWRETRDRQQIEELLWRYARTLDSADADGYAAVYTPDGEFSAGSTSLKGREALRKFVADLKQTRQDRLAKGENPGATLHMTANHHIAFTGPDSATVHSYWLTMFPGSGAQNPDRLGAVGRAVDQLVRVDGKWLIKVRNVAPQD